MVSGAVARRRAALGGAIKPRQIDAAFQLFLSQFEPRFEPIDAAHQLRHQGHRLVDLRWPRHLGIAQVAVQGVEEKKWILATIRKRDATFSLAKQYGAGL